ncbi:co-chaperone GroES [Patescibacteria group bacterium]|nr:co-chaperone GroES [Patescibacteria group bacterium]
MAKSTAPILPVPGYLLVQPKKKEKVTASGIVLPESHEEKPQEGEVLAVGADFVTDYGTKKTAPCTVGDTVVYREWGGKEYKVNDVEYLILKFEDIMAIVK